MFQNLNFKFQDKNGFTLIEGIVAVAMFSIICLVLFSLFGTILSTIRNNKAKVTANSVALEQLEVIRGMKFDSIATDTGWVPPGPIPSERSINKGGFSFTIQVDIAFVDDPFDGTDGGSPGDLFPYDYKRARVKVIWTNPVTGEQETVAMSTDVAPHGLEGGTGLMVVAIDAYGAAVPNAEIDVTSVNAGYTLDDALTDLNGNLWIGGLDPSDDYHIVATKNGYSVAQTYPIDNNPASPDYNPNPTKPNAVVIDDEVTRVVLSIDLLAGLEISTVNYDNPQNWQVDTDNGSDHQTDIDMAIDDSDRLYLVWVDDAAGVKKLYAQKYNLISHLAQWASDIQIATGNSQINPRIKTAATADGDYFFVVWNDDSTGNQDIYLQKFNFSDGSPVWNKVKVNIEAGNSDQIKSDLAVDAAGNIFVVWEDDRNGDWDIYAQKYDLDGNSLWALDLKVNNDAGIALQKNPRIIIDDEDNFFVVWDDEINGDEDIFLAKFDGSGNTLFAGKKINTDISGLDQYEPSIVFDGVGYVYLCWSDKRNSQPDIYAQKFNKAGERANDGNWIVADVKINDDSVPGAWRTGASLAYFSDGAIYFSWEDDRNGDFDIYSAKFDSDGNKLWAYDLIMSNDGSLQTQNGAEIIIDSSGYAVTVWEDFRNAADFDIYATRYNNLSIFPRSDVSITVTGAKLKGTYPEGCIEGGCSPIYKYSENFVSDANGIISIGDGVSEIEWDNYSFAAGGGHTLISTDPGGVLLLEPGTTGSIIINVEP